MGAAEVRKEIVLVLFDGKSSKAMAGELPKYDDDLRLYKSLLDAGAGWWPTHVWWLRRRKRRCGR